MSTINDSQKIILQSFGDSSATEHSEFSAIDMDGVGLVVPADQVGQDILRHMQSGLLAGSDFSIININGKSYYHLSAVQDAMRSKAWADDQAGGR